MVDLAPWQLLRKGRVMRAGPDHGRVSDGRQYLRKEVKLMAETLGLIVRLAIVRT